MVDTESLECLTVVKVGGSLLASGQDIERVAAALVSRRRENGPLLVVASALKGVTDLLDLAAHQALDRQRQNGRRTEALDQVRERHLDALRDSSGGGPSLDRIRGTLDEAAVLVGSIRDRGELSDDAYARLLSYGERLSVILLADAIRAAGFPAVPIAAEEAGVRAAGPARFGSCDVTASTAGLERIRPQLSDRMLVLTGFYGIDLEGDVVLFGRGGTDDTACAVAAGLAADRLELWKDVPGLMSADPLEVRAARVIPEISFDEVAQLGAYGSRVVHFGCLDHLRGRSIEVCISSIPGSDDRPGTRLVERRRPGATEVVALASRRFPALVGAVGDGVALDPRIRSRMLSCLAGAGIRGELVAEPSGHSGLSCAIHPEDLLPALSGLHEIFFTPESSEV